MKKLFVGGLAWATDEASLRAAFGKFGDVTDVVIVKDNATGRSRGFGFVSFQSDSAAAQALAEMNDKDLDGRKICCREAVERGPQSRGPHPDRGPHRGPNPERGPNQERSFDRGQGQERPSSRPAEPRTFRPRVELPPPTDNKQRARRKDRKKKKERDDGDFHDDQNSYDDRGRRGGGQKDARRDRRTRWRGNSYFDDDSYDG